MIRWKDELANIVELTKTKTLQEIGDLYGVSRQRMYQVFEKFGVETGQRQRANFLRDKPPKYYWLNKMLCLKGLSKQDRLHLLQTMDIPDVCPILGIPLNYFGGGESTWSHKDDSPSIDQLVAGKGYTKDNINIMSWRANRIKNDGTHEELQAIANWVKNKTCN